MIGVYHNITTVLMLQSAISVIVDKIALELNSHATCIMTDGNWHNNEVHLNHLPAVRGDCQTWDEKVFIQQVQHGVTSGCSFFVVNQGCTLLFLDKFHQIHDWVDQKFEKKVLVVLDTQSALTYLNVMDILRHKIVIHDIPLTLLLQPNVNNEWISVWSSYPYDSYFRSYNRFFVGNLSFQYDKDVIPKLTDLNGLIVTGAFFSYPPYLFYNHVPPGTGNAMLFGSNETLPIHLTGQEFILLLEFCVQYNCSLTARVEYEEEMWGEVFDNQTGDGLLGALAKRDADVSVCALYLWEEPYKFIQYTSIIQKAVATYIVPKPLPLPYWQTPLLPFPAVIWCYVIGSFLICALALFLINVGQTKIQNSATDGHVEFGFFDSIYAVFKMSIFQGITIDIKFLSNITYFTAMLIFALVIGNLYCGALSSVMTITRYESPIDSLESLVNSKILYGGSSYLWLDPIEKSDYPPHKKLIQNFIVKTLSELHQLITQRRSAVTVEMLQHGTLCYQSFLDQESSKQYMIMKEPMYWQFTNVMSRETWPFREQMNRIVFMQQESGIQYYWEYLAASQTMDYNIQRNLEENARPPEGGEPIKLTVEHILGSLFLLLFGNALAAITLLIEILFNYISNKLKVYNLIRSEVYK